MYTNSRRMYSPQFSDMASVSVRRFAWAIGKSMPATVDLMVQLMPFVVNPSKVCSACKDTSKCQGCCFHNPALPQGLEALETVF